VSPLDPMTKIVCWALFDSSLPCINLVLTLCCRSYFQRWPRSRPMYHSYTMLTSILSVKSWALCPLSLNLGGPLRPPWLKDYGQTDLGWFPKPGQKDASNCCISWDIFSFTQSHTVTKPIIHLERIHHLGVPAAPATWDTRPAESGSKP
jgi:hypothetical protein